MAASAVAAAEHYVDPEGRGRRADGRMARLPALDGIRGLGIPLVMLYHHGAAVLGLRFGGGYLTVSMFFTLSGFLISRLLVQQLAVEGRISLCDFYSRRIRRLGPALLTVCLGVALVWTVFPGPTRSLRFRDLFWALFYGTNIDQLTRGESYGELFARPSPLIHTWSLSLEEQIYLVFPLLLMACWAVQRLRRHTAVVLIGAAALSFAAALLWTNSRGAERAYYATEARAGEFLLGAALGVMWARSPLTPRVARFLRTRAGIAVAFLLLGVEVLLWLAVGLDTWGLFRGLTLVNSLIVCALMAAASALPSSGVAAVLSTPLLVGLGQRAYVLYLVHWPVFVFLTADYVDQSELLLLLRFAVTFLLAESIHRLIEMPVLLERMWPSRLLWRGCALLAVGALVVGAFAPSRSIDEQLDAEALSLQRLALDALPATPPDAPSSAASDTLLPARVLVVGDSQSFFVGSGMAAMWGATVGTDVQHSPGVGCGTSPASHLRYLGTEYPAGHPGCGPWRDTLPTILDKFRPQIVVIVGGLADVADHRLDGRWVHIGIPDYDEWLRAVMNDFADEMTATGAMVLWLTHPAVDPPNPAGIDRYPEEDPDRMRRYNELIADVAASRPDVATADLAAFVESRPGGAFDPSFRPDGSHMLLTEAPDVVEFIADAIRGAFAGWVEAGAD